MVSITKLVLVLLVATCFIVNAQAAKKCTLSVSQIVTGSSGKYTTYTAAISNIGSTSVSSILLTPSATVKSVSNIAANGDGQYTLSGPSNSLAAGATWSFTFQAKTSSDVKWSTSCAAASATSAPSTSAPTAAPSKQTTSKGTTSAPKVTNAPTAAATTKASTSAPVNTGGSSGSSSGKKCSSGWWRPAPATTWQWQLTGTVDQSFDVQMYDIDLFDATASLISSLHSQGRVVICYYSTQYENWRPDAAQWPASTLGKNLDDWVGERFVDIRSTTVRNILAARLDLAVSKGCDGVEPDNVDGYQATTGFPLTANDQLDFNKWLANAAHARGLSVGLKNDGDQASALQPYFDWALNEQCNQYSECTVFNAFINANKAVFNCEYSGSASSVCPKMNTAKFSTLFKSLDLNAAIKSQCCSYASGGCVGPTKSNAAAYSCVTSKRSLVEELEEAVTPEEVQEIQEEPSQVDEDGALDAKMNSAPARAYTGVLACVGAMVISLALFF